MQELSSKAARLQHWKIVAPICVVVVIATGLSIWSLMALIIIALTFLSDKIFSTTILCFTMNRQSEINYEKFQNSFKQITKSNAIWRLKSKKYLSSIKQNAYAVSNVDREILTAEFSGLPNVLSNIQFPVLKTNAISYYFAPAYLLYQNNGKFASIPYSNLKLSQGSLRFVETESVPNDAKIVGSTWKFVNLSGRPDKRYNNNPEYPVVLYDQLDLTDSANIHLEILLSRLELLPSFTELLQGLGGQDAYSEELVLSDEKLTTKKDPVQIKQVNEKTPTTSTDFAGSVSVGAEPTLCNVSDSKRTEFVPIAEVQLTHSNDQVRVERNTNEHEREVIEIYVAGADKISPLYKYFKLSFERLVKFPEGLVIGCSRKRLKFNNKSDRTEKCGASFIPSGATCASYISVPRLKSEKCSIYFMQDCIRFYDGRNSLLIPYAQMILSTIDGGRAKKLIFSHEVNYQQIILEGNDDFYFDISAENRKIFSQFVFNLYRLIDAATSLGKNVTKSFAVTTELENVSITNELVTSGKNYKVEPIVAKASPADAEFYNSQKVKSSLAAAGDELQDLKSEELKSYSINQTVRLNDAKIPPPPPAILKKINESKAENIWVSKGTIVVVQGFTISDGLFYYGENLQGDWQMEPALVKPSMPVAYQPVDVSRSLMDYFPRYSFISDVARRGFLQWMAGGRCDPNADIGYVFLFYYGLERRVLRDLPASNNSLPGIEEVIDEIQRLLSIYEANNSFKNYATSLIDYLDSVYSKQKSYSSSPPSYSYHRDGLGLKMKIALAQMAVDKVPVSPEWALAWTKADQRISKRTPVTRCIEQFEILFQEIYKSTFGDGLKLQVNRTKLKVGYHPASGAEWRSTMNPKFADDLPDISAVSGPVNKLQILVDKVTAMLESYSRYLGRNPDSINLLDALIYIPLRIWPETPRKAIENLLETVNKNLVMKSYSEFCRDLGSEKPLNKEQLISFARMLDEQGVGMEPDVISGTKPPKNNEIIVLFAKSATNDVITPAYHAACVTLDLAAAVALVDGHASEAELDMLDHQIISWVHLSEGHRQRLKARLALLIQQPITLESVKKKLEVIPEPTRRSIGHLLAQLVQVDGVIAKEEVKLLERIYKALQLDSQLVYSDLHSTPQNIKSINNVGVSIDKKKLGSSFALDPERIAALQRETDQVSALLANVFLEEVIVEEPQAVLVTLDPVEEDSKSTLNIFGLDQDHSSFLKFLISRSSWTREELTDVASDFELMLDGALEQINEAALDHLDEQLFEGDDPVEINQNLVERISL